MPGDNTQSEQTFKEHKPKQMLVLVRYKPEGLMAADDLVGGVASKVQGVVDAVEGAVNSIPGLSLFLKEEKEPEKKVEKEYNYYKDYKDWDTYMNKMKNELPDKLKEDENQTLVYDFDADDADGREKEGKKLCDQIKGKISKWKDYEASFHFVGVGQGGNVANECIKELANEADFKKRWCVKSLLYIGTPLYKNLHQFDEDKAFNGKGKKYAFGNNFDLTHQVISYFEPQDDLLKMIAECNSNLLSVFTGKIKAQLVTTLARLMSIKSFGTGSDNKGNIDKIKDCKDDVEKLVNDCKDACMTIFNGVSDLVDPGKLPEFKKMGDGFDQVPGKCVKRLEKFADSLQDVKQGTSLDTSRIGVNKIFNVFCPLFDQVTGMLKVLSFDEKTQEQAADKLIQKSGIKKILAPDKSSVTNLPVDPYIEKVAAMAKEAEKKTKQDGQDNKRDAPKTDEQQYYDQSVQLIHTAKNKLEAVTEHGDLDVSKASADDKIKISEAITAMLLPMMISKKKIYGTILKYLPLEGLNSFLTKISADAAMTPLKNLLSSVMGDFDEGTDEEPGLKTSIQNLDAELNRIKGYLKKSDFPVHKDANSLYFIYNSNNLVLKKPYGPVLNTIDRETGYLDAMRSAGYDNTFDIHENRYTGGGSQNDNTKPVVMVQDNN